MNRSQDKSLREQKIKIRYQAERGKELATDPDRALAMGTERPVILR
jgi:hypothetical protein